MSEQFQNHLKYHRNRGKLDAPITQLHDSSLSLLDTIKKSGEVKLV